MNAIETLEQARELQAADPLVDTVSAYRLARFAQHVARKMIAEKRSTERAARVRAGDVANYVNDLRSFGRWDGE